MTKLGASNSTDCDYMVASARTLECDALVATTRLVASIDMCNDLVHAVVHASGIEPLKVESKGPQQVLRAEPLRSLTRVVD